MIPSYYSALVVCALRNELWGKAKEYLEASLRLRKSVDVYNELGQLLASLDELLKPVPATSRTGYCWLQIMCLACLIPGNRFETIKSLLPVGSVSEPTLIQV